MALVTRPTTFSSEQGNMMVLYDLVAAPYPSRDYLMTPPSLSQRGERKEKSKAKQTRARSDARKLSPIEEV